MNIKVSRGGSEIGEWDEEEIKSFHLDGRLVDTDLYWRPGMSEWAALSSLVNHSSSAPPPLPVEECSPTVALPHSQGLLILLVVGYILLAIIMGGIDSGSFNVVSILSYWFVNVTISGMVWFVYDRSAKPLRVKSFVVFACLSLGLFLVMLLGAPAPK